MKNIKILTPQHFALILFMLCLFIANDSFAQSNKSAPKNQPKSSEYVGKSQAKPKTYQGTKDLVSKVKKKKRGDAKGTGKVLTTKVKPVKSKIERGDDAKIRAGFLGNSPLVDNSGRRLQNRLSTASYSGNVSMKGLKKQGNSIKKNNKNLSSYRGNIKVANTEKQRINSSKKLSSYRGNIKVANTEKQRINSSKKLSEFKGANPIRVRKSPRGAIVANRNTPNANRNTAIYNKAKLGKGRKMDKKYLANYQKEKPRKLKYDSREVKMWNEGGVILPKRGSRDLPKNNKKANRKAAKRSSRDPGEEEEIEE